MLKFYILKLYKIKLHSIILIQKNKSTTINNILIIEDFYFKQIEISLNNFVYNKYLCLIINNLKIYKQIEKTF